MHRQSNSAGVVVSININTVTFDGSAATGVTSEPVIGSADPYNIPDGPQC